MSILIPDPGLTLSEAINTEGTIRWFLYRSRAGGDAVLGSAAEKLIVAARQVQALHPEEFEKVQREIEMQKRFGLNG